MARKANPAIPAKKTPPSGNPRPPSAKAPQGAHPRLMHGFLVRPPAKSTFPVGTVGPKSRTAAKVTTAAQRSSPARLEGPADDATFH